jgi:hypothetical protein
MLLLHLPGTRYAATRLTTAAAAGINFLTEIGKQHKQEVRREGSGEQGKTLVHR